jgi:hypothetical protein
VKQTFDFEQFDPPILNENILRRELEKRAERRRTILLTIAGTLFQAVFVLLGLLYWSTAPALALACIGFAIVSMVGSGVITIIYAQRGGAGYGPVYENSNI